MKSRKWKVKHTGKLLFIIYYYIFILGIYSLYSLRNSIVYGESFQYRFMEGLLLFSLALIIALITPAVWIWRKKIPHSIVIDAQLDIFTLNIKKKNLSFSLNELAFEIKRNSFYNVLIFYRKHKATRGHIIHYKLISIVSPVINMGWKMETLNEIAVYLEQMKIEKHSKKGNLNFIENLFEK